MNDEFSNYYSKTSFDNSDGANIIIFSMDEISMFAYEAIRSKKYLKSIFKRKT